MIFTNIVVIFSNISQFLRVEELADVVFLQFFISMKDLLEFITLIVYIQILLYFSYALAFFAQVSFKPTVLLNTR